MKSNQISYGVPGGVQQVIMGCIVALQNNPGWVLFQGDMANAHTDCSRDLIWKGLQADSFFHFLIQIFLCLYGNNCTPQWHFGNGPDQPPTSMHMSIDGLRQGETAPNVFFNILASRLYRAFMKILNGRGILLDIAYDVKICAPPYVLAEIVGKLPALAMSEAGLTTRTSKNRIYVQPSARAT